MTMALKQKKSALVASCCAVLAFGTAFTLAFGFGLAAAMVVGGLDPPWHIGMAPLSNRMCGAFMI